MCVEGDDPPGEWVGWLLIGKITCTMSYDDPESCSTVCFLSAGTQTL